MKCNFYSQGKQQRERVLRRCAEMRAAKERKRLESAVPVTAVECGRITFTGPVFGEHVLRIVARGDRDRVDLYCDGVAMRPRTLRGVRAMLARRIANGAKNRTEGTDGTD